MSSVQAQTSEVTEPLNAVEGELSEDHRGTETFCPGPSGPDQQSGQGQERWDRTSGPEGLGQNVSVPCLTVKTKSGQTLLPRSLALYKVYNLN